MPTRPASTTAQQAVLRIAVLEDDEALREDVLLPTLRDYGFHAVGAGSASALYKRMLGESFDIVLLDIGLPDESGLDVVRHLRGLFPHLGLVMLTGSRGRNKQLRALTDGADAFLSKPVDGEVLAATLHSLSRRLQGPGALPPGAAPPAGTGRWRFDSDGWCLVAPNGALLALTVPERRVLRMLVEAGGQPVAREALIEAMADGVPDFDPHRLDMLVHRLRRKAAALTEDAHALPLLAARGVGYLFAG